MEAIAARAISLEREISYPKYACLSGNALKVIAMILMTADHLAWTFQNAPFSTQWWAILIHVFGRIVAPIFWFMMAEGWYYTKNPKNYLIRLFIGAFISHFAYCFYTEQPVIPFLEGPEYETSVMWGLAIAGLALYLTDDRYFSVPAWAKALIYLGFGVIAFPCDWSSCGYFAIILLYYFRGSFWKQMLHMMMPVAIYSALYCVYTGSLLYGLMALCVALAIPILRLYNGQPGKGKAMKAVYYLYYPAHLATLGLIQLLLGI